MVAKFYIGFSWKVLRYFKCSRSFEKADCTSLGASSAGKAPSAIGASVSPGASATSGAVGAGAGAAADEGMSSSVVGLSGGEDVFDYVW